MHATKLASLITCLFIFVVGLSCIPMNQPLEEDLLKLIAGSFTTAEPTNASLDQLIINEIMHSPAVVSDTAGEWFELYNPTADDVDIDGWTIKDENYDIHVIDNGGSLIVPAGGFLVLGNNGDSMDNGGVNVDYVYTGINLHTVEDELILLNTDQTEVDRVMWYDGSNFPDLEGAAMALKDPALDNNVGDNWCVATTPYSSYNSGTPGAVNDCEPEEPPPFEITCPADTTVECGESTDPNETGSATVPDGLDPAPTIDYSDITEEGSCPEISQITRTWTATDATGTSVSCDQIISVVDTTPPVLSGVPADATVECDAVPEAAEVTADDNCDEEPVLEFNEEKINGDCSYVLKRTWTATDACGNSYSAVQTITVQDTTPPVITCPNDIEVEPTSPDGTTVTYLAPIVSDNCSNDVTTSQTEGLGSGATFPIGTTSESYTATDECGNTTSCTFTVKVLSPEEVATELIEQIEELIMNETLKQGQGNGLINKLMKIIDKLESAPHLKPACNQLGAFINQVEGFVNAGKLTAEQGNNLIDSAINAGKSAGCTGNPF